MACSCYSRVISKEITNLLNELLDLDSTAISSLIDSRVNCNDRIVDHPTVTVANDGLGVLGILNGILGKHGMVLVANYDENNNLTSFSTKEATE